jgi:hypothetical protein
VLMQTGWPGGRGCERSHQYQLGRLGYWLEGSLLVPTVPHVRRRASSTTAPAGLQSDPPSLSAYPRTPDLI